MVQRGTVPSLPQRPRSARVAGMWLAIVAGAGPAGALAAITLARSGHRVLLADKVGDRADSIGEALPEAAGR
ncbi:MAG TPA: NAD(P)-binding protein, partial [Reyranella sp.]